MYRRTLVFTMAVPMMLAGLEPNKTEVVHESHPMQPGAKLTVENINGAIEISGWDQSMIDITATKYAESDQLLAQLKVDVAVAADGVHIRTIAPSESGEVGVKYVLKVPRRAELAEIRSTNGAIRITEIEGGANLRTTNGSVHAAKTRGKLEIGTSNGAVQIEENDGETDVHTSNGSIRASGMSGPLTAVTSNGAVDLRLASATLGSVKAATSNGGITLRMPAGGGARVRAVTSSRNKIVSDFEVRKEGDNSESHLQGVVGGGGPDVELSTSHGSIRLLKL
jgi:Putative adhesin